MKKAKMINRKFNIKENGAIIICIILIIMWGMYRIDEQYMPIILLDEFGVWSNAAYFTGRDWSEIAQYNSYYSYGYSIILALLMKIFSSTNVIIYQIAICFNSLFLIIAFLLMINIGQLLFPQIEKIWIIASAFIAINYPTYFANAHIAWAETLLVFAFVVSIWILLCFLHRPCFVNAYLWSFTLVYMYTVHQRCLGILISGIIILVLLLITKKVKKRYVIFAVGSILILILAHGTIKSFIRENVIMSSVNDKATINDYASILGFVKHWTSVEGIKKLFISLIGKAYYLVLSTYGLFVWGCLYIVTAIKNIKICSFENIKNNQWIYIYISLSFISVYLIASIFTLDAVRLDSIVYGRYTEWAIAPIILIGLLSVNNNKMLNHQFYSYFITCILFVTVIFLCIYKNHPEWTEFFSICSLTMSAYYKITENNGYQFIIVACLFVTLIMVILFNLLKKKKSNIYIFVIIILLYNSMSYRCVYRVFGSNYRSNIVRKIDEVIPQNENNNIYFIYEKGQMIWYVADLQVLNPDMHIKSLGQEDLVNIKGYVLVSSQNKYCLEEQNKKNIMVRDGKITLLYIE